jgi:1-acyl-sn-glycerol-3-phosphate acyltransferase
LLVYMIVALPTLLLPHRLLMELAKSWSRTSVRLLRIVCGIRAEFIGLDKIPRGACIVAAKHQSAFETFALLPLFVDPTFILKRELMWIPIFGWYTWKGGMIPVDRTAPVRALTAMTRRARSAFAQGRQIIIFPEGTRRPPGAEPRYRSGIVHLYAETGAVCVPIALNSGLFWPRRRLRKSSGTIRIEILDPIQSGLDKDAFMSRLESAIEAATARLVAEGERELRDSTGPGEAGVRA